MVTTLGLLRSICLAFFFLPFLTSNSHVLNATGMLGSGLSLILQVLLSFAFAGAHPLTTLQKKSFDRSGEGS